MCQASLASTPLPVFQPKIFKKMNMFVHRRRRNLRWCSFHAVCLICKRLADPRLRHTCTDPEWGCIWGGGIQCTHLCSLSCLEKCDHHGCIGSCRRSHPLWVLGLRQANRLRVRSTGSGLRTWQVGWLSAMNRGPIITRS